MSLRNVVQWDWFLQMSSSRGPFPQKARKIDTKLSNALAFLHERELPKAIKEPKQAPFNFLAFRNLLRGYQFALPSGTSVAQKYGFDAASLEIENPDGGEPIIAPDSLWYYILKEAEDAGGDRLGKVGSTIVCATFAGLLKGDPNSYLNVDPSWTPENDVLLNEALAGTDFDQDAQLTDLEGNNFWTLAAIIRLSGLPVDANGIERN